MSMDHVRNNRYRPNLNWVKDMRQSGSLDRFSIEENLVLANCNNNKSITFDTVKQSVVRSNHSRS